MISELENVGLTQRQAKIYLALIELGSSSTGEIVKKSQVPSSKIYEVLEKLIEKGLVSKIIKNNRKLYQASEPESLLEMLDSKKSQLERIIPKLKEKKNSSKEESATLFQGKEGLKNALRKVLRILEKDEEYLVYIPDSEKLEEEYLKIFLNNLNLKRNEKGIKTKLLVHESQKEKVKKDYPQKIKNQKLKFTKSSFPSRLGIFKNHVLIISGDKEISSILINSKETYESYRKFFENLWKKNK